MKVKVKKLNPNAVIPYKSHNSDYCYDCVATSCEEIAPNVYKYGLGLAFEIIREDGDDVENLILDIDARPRSSVWKTGMVLSNCTGTIDESYRGEVAAIFYHVMPDMPKYEVGDRVVQISIGITTRIDFEEVDELTETERGVGGFGSTGK